MTRGSSRIQPQVGGRALVVSLAEQVPATITRMAGQELEAQTESGEIIQFTLHPVTAHFVRRGDPYWGVRLRLLQPVGEGP